MSDDGEVWLMSGPPEAIVPLTMESGRRTTVRPAYRIEPRQITLDDVLERAITWLRGLFGSAEAALVSNTTEAERTLIDELYEERHRPGDDTAEANEEPR